MQQLFKYLFLIILVFSTNVLARLNSTKDVRWISIGEGTYINGFTYPYKVKLSVPYGEKNISDMKQGLIPMKFTLLWLPFDFSKKSTQALFTTQIKSKFTPKESYVIYLNVINKFIEKLPATIRGDEWVFIYHPDQGTKLFIKDKLIHHLIGAAFNRALINSWINDNPVLTSHLFTRLLKLQ